MTYRWGTSLAEDWAGTGKRGAREAAVKEAVATAREGVEMERGGVVMGRGVGEYGRGAVLRGWARPEAFHATPQQEQQQEPAPTGQEQTAAWRMRQERNPVQGGPDPMAPGQMMFHGRRQQAHEWEYEPMAQGQTMAGKTQE